MTYILIEGGDGSGKDTQADLLINRLGKSKKNPLRVAEPCEDLPTGRLLRQLLASGEHQEAQAALFLADRMALQASTIVPALTAGRPVVSVRSFISTLVYQQENWPLDWLIEIHTQMLVKPDVVIYLDIDPAMGLLRVDRRMVPRDMYEKMDIQKRNRARYLSLMESKLPGLVAKGAQFAVIDASKDRDSVHEQVWATLPKWLRS